MEHSKVPSASTTLNHRFKNTKWVADVVHGTLAKEKLRQRQMTKNTATEIAWRLGRSRKAVTNYQRALLFGRPLPKLGPPRKISPIVTRGLKRKAHTVNTQLVTCSRCTNWMWVCGVCSSCCKMQNIWSSKSAASSSSSPYHKKARVDWARDSLRSSESIWRQTIWYVEESLISIDQMVLRSTGRTLACRDGTFRANNMAANLSWSGLPSQRMESRNWVLRDKNERAEVLYVLEESLLLLVNDVHRG